MPSGAVEEGKLSFAGADERGAMDMVAKAVVAAVARVAGSAAASVLASSSMSVVAVSQTSLHSSRS